MDPRWDEATSNWYLESPVKVTNLCAGEYILDVEVTHGIGDWDLTESDRPVVSRLIRIERADGEPFTGELRLNMRAIAIDAVVKYAYRALRVRRDAVWIGTTSGDDWRKAASVVRFAASGFGRTRWTPEIDRWLIDSWRHLFESGSGTLADLAAELGVPPHRVSVHRADLRKTHGEDVVPKGSPGRKPSTKKEEE